LKKIFEKSEIILAIILLISFFLPWIEFLWYSSGIQVPLMLWEWPAAGVVSYESVMWIRVLSYLFFIVYLIPVFCAIIIIQGLRKKKTRIFSLSTGIIIYLLLFYNLIVYPEYLFHLLFSAWITLITGLLLIFASILKNKYFKLIEN